MAIPLTPDMLDQLTPAQKTTVNMILSSSGQDAAMQAYEQIVERNSRIAERAATLPAPREGEDRVRAPRTTERDVRKSRPAARAALARTIREKALLRGEAMSFEESRRLAVEEMARIESTDTTLEGDPIGGTSQDEVRNASFWAIPFKAMSPQTRAVGERGTPERSGMDPELHAELRRIFLDGAHTQAIQDAEEQNIRATMSGKEYKDWITDRRFDVTRERWEELTKVQFIQNANDLIRERGLDRRYNMKADDQGLLVAVNPETNEIDYEYTNSLPQIQEIRREAHEATKPQMRHIAENVAPELLSITSSGGNTLHLGTWRVPKSPISSQVSDRPAWFTIQEALQEGDTRAQLYELGRGVARQDDIETGDVTETWPSATMRNLFAGLSLSPVVFTSLKKLTWDRNPETGLPYNEDDYMYRLEQWQDKQINDLLELREQMLTGDLSEEEAEAVADEIYSRKFSAPVAVATKMFAGSGYNVPEHMNTGSDWNDFWIAHSNGEWTGSYLEKMDNIGVMSPWYPTAAGLFIEIMTPIKQTGLGVGLKAARKATAVSSKAAAEFAKGLQYDSVGEFFNNVNRWADTERSLTEALVARRALRDYERYGGIGPSGVKLVDDYRDISLAEDFAGKTGPDIAARVLDTAPLTDPFKSKWFKGFNASDVNGRAVSRVARARDQLWQAAKTAADEGKDMLAILAKSRSGRELRDLYVLVKNSMPSASMQTLANETIVSFARKEMYSVLQDALPNAWVRITPNMIAKKSAFRAVKGQFIDKTRSYVKHSTKKNAAGKYVYKFDDSRKTAVAVTVGASGDRYADINKKLITKIKNGEDLTQQEFLRATNFVMNAVAEGLLGRVGAKVIKGQRITKQAYKGRSIAQAMGAKGGAAAAAIDRELTAIGGLDDFTRGVRITLSGKSDYLRAISYQGTSGRGLKLVGMNPKEFGKRIDPLLDEAWERTANLMNAVPERLQRTLSAASDDPDAANKILKELFDGDEVASYKEVLELFWAPKGRTFGDLFNNTYGNTDRFTQIVSDGLASGAIPRGPLTLNGIQDAIGYVGSRVSVAGLDDMAIKQKRFGGIFGLKSKDDIGQLWSAYVIMKHAQKAFDKGMRLMEQDLPGLFQKLPELGGTGAAYRARMFKDILLAGGIDSGLARNLERQMRGALKSYSPSDQRVIAKQVLGYITDTGFMPASNQMSKILETVQNTMLTVMAKDSDLLKGLGRSVDDMKQVIFAHHGGKANAKGVVQLPVDPDAARQAMSDLDAMSNAWVKASTDLDINSIHGILNQLGVPTNAAKVFDTDGVSNIGASFGRLPENRIALYGPEFEDLVKKFENVDIVARVNDSLSRLRPAHRVRDADHAQKGWARTADFFDITRKTTITGLLGGFPLIGTRFLGTNALTAPFIVGITTPSYFATSLRTVPTAIRQSFVRATRRTGAVTGPSTYDFATLERVAGTGDEILFESMSGITWTRNMLEEAIERNNIRFSRATFDFQFDVLADAQRAARIGPNGKPVGGGKNLWNFWRPDRKNFFSIVAEEMDNIQREAVFAQALRNGETEANAALLARNSMLDYGALPPSTKKTIAKRLAFFAFRYRMTADFFGALARGGQGARNIGRVGALINSQYEDMEEWLITPDWAKTRFWKTAGKDFQQYSAAHFGIQVPWSEPLFLLGNVSNLFFNRQVGTLDKAAALAVTALDQFDPRAGPVIEFFSKHQRVNAADTYAFGGYVPGHFAALCEQVGLFDFAADLFGWQPVKPGKERPDLPLIRGRQYTMTKEGSRWWLLWQEASLMLGIKRNLDDYTRAFAKFGLKADNIKWKRDAEGDPWLFLLGGTTNSILNSPSHIDMFKQKYILMQYQQMIRNQTR